MMFLYLVFGHLLADFALQPNKLIAWKGKSWMGVFCHALIHFIVASVILLPYLRDFKVWIGLATIAGSHFIIDVTKIYVQRQGASNIRMFFLDQACHLSVLAMVGSWWSLLPLAGSRGWHAVYANPYLLIYFILVVLLLFVVDIVRLQFVLEKDHAAQLRRDWKAAFVRLGIITVIYLLAVYLLGD